MHIHFRSRLSADCWAGNSCSAQRVSQQFHLLLPTHEGPVIFIMMEIWNLRCASQDHWADALRIFQALSAAHIKCAAIDFIIIIHIDLIKFHRRVTCIDSRSEATHACVNGHSSKWFSSSIREREISCWEHRKEAILPQNILPFRRYFICGSLVGLQLSNEKIQHSFWYFYTYMKY